MTDRIPESNPTTTEAAESYAAPAAAPFQVPATGDLPPLPGNQASGYGGGGTVNEIAAIGHDLSNDEGIAAANTAISGNVNAMGQKIGELRRIMEARARMNAAYKQLNKATARTAPLDQVVPLLKELEELKESGIPVFYPAEQVTEMLTKAEESRIIIDEYLRILTAGEQHECCQKGPEA